MMSEHDICELLSSLLPSGRLNRCFESDAEILDFEGRRCLFTTDEFSAEDLFQESDPYCLGWNIAVGGISDILASGGRPLFYAHALTVDRRWDAKYLSQFGCGVRDVLLASGTRFIGGDCGRSETWRCTVSVIGSCEGPPVLRRGAAPGDIIYLSGSVGAGNLEAALTLHGSAEPIRTQFAVRGTEAAVMRKYAAACMDTSDGVCAALNTLADLNGCGYAVENPPYLPAGVRHLEAAGWPGTLLFLGECGEYELLFAVKPQHEAMLLAEARSAGLVFHRLGAFMPSGRVLREGGRTLDLSSLRMHARDFEQPQQYLQALLQWLGQQRASALQAPGKERI
jgi:thiamine-monophosphate kinase